MKPIIGLPVQYFENCETKPKAAIITNIYSDTEISIAYFEVNGEAARLDYPYAIGLFQSDVNMSNWYIHYCQYLPKTEQEKFVDELMRRDELKDDNDY